MRAAADGTARGSGHTSEAGPTPVELHEIELPVEGRALCTLPRVDYVDSFHLTSLRAGTRTAEEWARAMLEGAPPGMRTALRRGWLALGLRVGPRDDPRRVLGWEIQRSTPEFAVLGANSVAGMDAQLLFKREHDALLFATTLKLSNPVVRVLWGMFSPQHRRVVRQLLRELARREG